MPASIEVLIIGAGPSGLFAAIELARRGVLATAGVVDRVLAESEHLGFARLFDAHLRQVSETAFAGAGCPWEFQCSLPQWRTERILADRVDELGGTVERGVESAPAARTVLPGNRWPRRLRVRPTRAPRWLPAESSRAACCETARH